jgi:MraZ protein
MTNLINTYECKADAKGRVALPGGVKKELAPVLNDGFVVKRSIFQNCLELYTKAEWDKEMEEVNKLNRFIKKNVDFIRKFMAGVRTVEVDSSGRINIPNELIAFAKIKKDIVLTSQINKIEIWDKESYERVMNDEEVDIGTLAEDVMGQSHKSAE